MKAQGAASGPLVAWLVREFEPRAAFGGWELRMRRGSRPTHLYQGQWLDDGRLVVDLPQLGNDPIARIAVMDPDAGQILIDSADAPGLVVSDEEGAKANWKNAAEDVWFFSVSDESNLFRRPNTARNPAICHFRKETLHIRLGRSISAPIDPPVSIEFS